MFAIVKQSKVKYFKMAIPRRGNTQIARLAKELLKLMPDVTAGDRAEAITEFKTTKATISTYLNGKGVDNEMAVNLLVFFRNKIEAREKVIS